MSDKDYIDLLAATKRQNRLLKQALALSALALVVLAAAGANQLGKFDVIQVERLYITSNDGKTRALLGLAPDNSPCLLFYDKEGKLLCGFGPNADGSSQLFLNDKSEEERMKLEVSEDGSPNIVFRDKEGLNRIGLGEKDGLVGIGFLDSKGKHRLGIEIQKDDSTSLNILDKGGKPVFKAP